MKLIILLAVVVSVLSRTILPQPSLYSKGAKYSITVIPARDFFVVLDNIQSAVLKAGIARYHSIIFFENINGHSASTTTTTTTTATSLQHVHIAVASADETLQQDIDESYSLEVDAPNGTLKAKTVYGALRGLETLSQLIDYTSQANSYIVYDAPYIIQDSPRFPYRGLLIDTGRHFLQVDTIKTILDGMSYAKLNVLHWHGTDDQSFPFPSKTYPDLQKAAFTPRMSYSWEDIVGIVEYARMRGIRVVPEFDGPGHSLSWGVGYPEFLLPNCTWPGTTSDPINPFTYKLLQGFLTDMSTLFFDNYVHVGADEVNFTCWESSQAIQAWAAAHHTNMAGVESFYVDNLQRILSSISRTMMCWEECYTNNLTTLPKDALIGVWRAYGDCYGPCRIAEITKAGYQVVLSAGWYLDHMTLGWWDMYAVEPFQNISNQPVQQALVKGGEACMWGEHVTDASIITRIFPRAAAVAERLWSPQEYHNITAFETRLYEFSCRNTRRGVQFDPWRPGYCQDGYGEMSANP